MRAGQTLAFVPPASVIVGTPQTLSATASSGLTPEFDTWTPGTCSVTGTGTVTATALALCGIRVSQPGNDNFAPAPQRLVLLPVDASYPITTSADPAGGGTVECMPNPVPHGDDASCTQVPNAGYTFSHWSGDCSGTGACTLTNVTAAQTVTAHYTLDSYAITVNASPISGGTVSCTPNHLEN